MKLKSMLKAGIVSMTLATPAAAADYTMSVSADFSGPVADVMPNAMAGIKAVVNWWNAEVGKDLGVTVNAKIYDMRYDPAVVAKTWPAILSSDHPIMHLGFGAPDLLTLMKRLPNDKVPMLMGTAMVGPVWTDNGWHFSIRPTYSHEFSGLLSKLQEDKGEKLLIAAISTQNKAGFVDQVNGVKKLAEMYPDRFEVVDVEWADPSPVSTTAQVRGLAAKSPDVVIIGGTTAQVIATANAMKELGLDIPIVMSTHNGLSEVAKGISLDDLEGSFSAFSFASPGGDTEIRKVFEEYKQDGEWGLMAAQASAQAVLALRILENAIAEVGADNVTGQAMYDALIGNVYDEASLLGALPTIDYDTTAPFPIGDLKSVADVVHDGEIVPLTDGWMSIPALEKW